MLGFVSSPASHHGRPTALALIAPCVALFRQIRNPHGWGEWKGDFHDKCPRWTQDLKYDAMSVCLSACLSA